VLFALIYLLVRRAVRLAAGSASELHSDIEIMVLRHQLAVLKRQVGRPRLRRRDRLVMAALSRVLPRSRWSSFVVSPQTLLRWHRELVRRKWNLSFDLAGGGGFRFLVRDRDAKYVSSGGWSPSRTSSSGGVWPYATILVRGGTDLVTVPRSSATPVWNRPDTHQAHRGGSPQGA